MGFLDSFEKGLERVITGAFNKTFKSQLEPIEIASAIKGEMDTKASIVSRDRILAPNTFHVRLSSSDFKRMRDLGQPLIEELENLTTKHANKQGYQFGGALAIDLSEDGSLNIGQVVVASATEKLEVQWTPVLETGGKRFVLGKARTSVGRDDSADIKIDDSGLSRVHFEVVWDGSNAAVRDLGSTNGTKVAGRSISEQAIGSNTAISAGRTDFVFKVIAKTVNNNE